MTDKNIILADEKYGMDYDKLAEKCTVATRTHNNQSDIKKAIKHGNDLGTGSITNEWYTPYQTILNELSKYPAHIWKDKDIICPCDFDILASDPNVFAIRIEFTRKETEPISTTDSSLLDQIFRKKMGNLLKNTTITANEVSLIEVETSKQLGYKPKWSFADNIEKVTSKYPNVIDKFKITGTKEEKARFLSGLRCNFIKALLVVARNAGCHSITASGYDPFRKEGFKGYDALDIDYSKYDIVVTNPPFSNPFCTTFTNILDAEWERRKDSKKPFNYIIMSSFIGRADPVRSVKLAEKRMFLGFNRDFGCEFVTRDDFIKDADALGSVLNTKGVACDWLTSYPYGQDAHNAEWRQLSNINVMALAKNYHFIDTVEMVDGSHPLFGQAKTAPMNYTGWIQCAHSFLDYRINTDVYECIPLGCAKWMKENNRWQSWFKDYPKETRSSEGFGCGLNILIKVKPEYVAAHPEITWYSYEDVMKAREEE